MTISKSRTEEVRAVERALAKDPPAPRSVQPPEMGQVVIIPEVGGVHHHYERRAA